MFSFASLSMLGNRATNEDAVGCWQTPDGCLLACVADGLGGLAGGHVASRIAVSVFAELSHRSEIGDEDLLTAAHKAHLEIKNAQLASDNQQRMATTLTCVLVTNSAIYGVHCGDSRAVIARGSGIKRLTEDHSEGQRLFRAGKLSKEELFVYGRKHVLESALGTKDDPRLDSFKFEARSGDKVVLTTDGVHNIVFLRELQHICSTATTPSSLVDRVGGMVEDRGPKDNFSIVAIFVE